VGDFTTSVSEAASSFSGSLDGFRMARQDRNQNQHSTNSVLHSPRTTLASEQQRRVTWAQEHFFPPQLGRSADLQQLSAQAATIHVTYASTGSASEDPLNPPLVGTATGSLLPFGNMTWIPDLVMGDSKESLR
jgi:hypothetical protein